MGLAGRFRAARDPWPGTVVGGALAVLVALAAVVAARAAGAWVRPPLRPAAPGEGALRAPAPRPAAPRRAAPRNVEPLVPSDPTRILIDLLDCRGQAAARPRLLALPAGSGLPALLAAAGLPPDLAVAGAPGPPGVPLPTGTQLAVGPDGRARLAPMPADRRLRLGLPLDLNTASADDLARLPRIGSRLAARIVEDRAARGPFAAPEALLRVRGIGPATVQAVRDRVTAVLPAEAGAPDAARPAPQREAPAGPGCLSAKAPPGRGPANSLASAAGVE